MTLPMMAASQHQWSKDVYHYRINYHTLPLRKNLFGMSTCFARRYSQIFFPSPSYVLEALYERSRWSWRRKCTALMPGISLRGKSQHDGSCDLGSLVYSHNLSTPLPLYSGPSSCLILSTVRSDLSHSYSSS